jgi:PAS domain S-box-containing protein
MHESLSNQDLQHKTSALEAQVAAITAAARSVLELKGFEPTARAIFDVCKSAVGATAGYVTLLAEDGSENEILLLDDGGPPCPVDPSLPMPIRGLPAQVCRDAKAAFDNRFSTGPRNHGLPAGHVELKNVLFAPLVIDDTVVGLFGLANKPTDFDQDDAALASILGGFAAMALRQARAEDQRRRSEASQAASEEKFRQLFETMNEGVCLHELIYDDTGTAMDYRIIDANPAYEQITGLAKKTAVGTLASAIHQTGQPLFLSQYAQVVETGKPRSFEIHWPPMNKHFLINAFSMAKGRFATVFTDITDSKAKEDALCKNSQHLSITLDSIGDAVISTDAEGRITLMNPVAENLTGWPLAEALGQFLEQVFVIVNEYTHQAVENPAVKVLRENAVVGLANHTVLISRDGSEYFIENSGAPIRDADGAIQGIVIIFRDVTEKRLAERILRDNEQALEAIYNNAPVVMMLVDDQMRVCKVNRFAIEFANRSAEEMAGLLGGEAIRCLSALVDPRGCGFGPRCAQCTVRLAVSETLETGRNHHRVQARLPFKRDGQDQEITFLLSTTGLKVREQSMVLVSILDIPPPQTGRE